MLKLVRLNEQYQHQLIDMLEEWEATGERIIPSAIHKFDCHNFEYYIKNLEIKEPKDGFVPESTFFCLDTNQNKFIGAISIRHYLNNSLLLSGGHIGDGVRPSKRRKGIATAMIQLALNECKDLGIKRVLMVCDKTNIASAKSIQHNRGILENEIIIDGIIKQRYWIDLSDHRYLTASSLTC